MASQTFKVIVVGGGPVGLTAAHALHKAGIDFVVLERRPAAVIDAGSNLVLSPLGLSVLYQLGLGEPIKAVSSPLGRIDRLDHQGRDIGDSHIFTQIEKVSGHPLRVISRHDLTKVLYEALPEDVQRRILPNKKLSTIVNTAEGVIATCADGSTYAGSLIIGADGAHSTVRELMRTLAISNKSAQINEEMPFLTTYRCLWIRFPKNVELPTGTTCETHGHNASTQLFIGEDSGVIGLYERLETPTKERLRHTQADQDSCVDRWGHLPVMPGTKITLRDLYTSRQEAGLVSLEEGVVDHWSLEGRIALTGDAAHKYTPSTGAGCNTGMIDIVALVNEIHAVLESSETPSHAQIDAALKSYQNSRQATVTAECATAGQATGLSTWQTGVHKFIDRRVFSLHVVQRLLISRGGKPTIPSFSFILREGAGFGGGHARPVVMAS